MEAKTLSSSLTFFYKYVFMTVWSVGFGLGTLSLFFQDGEGLPRYQFLAAWAVGTIFIYLATGRTKKVSFDGENFYVSNFFSSAVIQVENVKAVSGSVLLSPELVWLKLHKESPFGKTIIFMPKIRLFGGFWWHPLVEELRQKCGLAA